MIALRQVLARLQPWLEQELFDWVMKMHLYRDIYLSWNESLNLAPGSVRKAGHFHQWVRDGYVAFMAMAIRRETDPAMDSRSLVRFLREVQAHAGVLDSEWYFERVVDDSFGIEPYEAEWAVFADQSLDHVDPEHIQQDIDSLIAKAAAVRQFATRTLAHRLDPEVKPAPSVTYAEVHAAMGEIERVFRRWYQFLTGTHLASLDAYNWEHVLAEPWITQDQALALFEARQSEQSD